MGSANANPATPYRDHVANLKRYLDSETAAQTAIGGEFLPIGVLEHQLLKSIGLRDGHQVVDVGCGSGRLAFQLKRYANLRYLGIDVVPDLLEHAARITGRTDWRFTTTDGGTIPLPGSEADFVCFFSVLTHLLHEESYRYLREAYRVLKPGGRVVFSFLEFRIPCHWDQFQHSVRHPNAKQHLNQFIDRDAIAAWSQRIGFTVESIADGDQPHIPLDEEVRFESGQRMRGLGNLGQSVAVLRKPVTETLSIDAGQMHFPAPAGLLRDDDRPVDASGWKPIAANSGRFICVSARGFVGHGNSVLIVGFVVVEGQQRVLVRATTAALTRLGVTDVLSRPQVSVYDRSRKLIAENTGWATLSPVQQAAVRAAIEKTGAEPLDEHGHDPALELRLAPGDYTVVVHGRDGGTGLVVVEVCEMPEGNR